MESEGQAERDCDGNNSQAVAPDPRLETVKSSIPARQKVPGTSINRWLREVCHYISRGVLRTGITVRQRAAPLRAKSSRKKEEMTDITTYPSRWQPGQSGNPSGLPGKRLYIG